jgi:hypothetical protein
LTDRFLKEKDKYHFILITSETDYFVEYENKFYKEKISEIEKKKKLYGLQTRVSKEINLKIVKSLIKKDKSKRLSVRLKEFDNLKKSLLCFMKKNYPYVSYVYGGFKDIHEQSLKYNIPLLNHDENCYICIKNRKKTQKVGFFQKIFSSKSNYLKIKSILLENYNTESSIKNQISNNRKISQEDQRERGRHSFNEKSKSFDQNDHNIMSKQFI